MNSRVTFVFILFALLWSLLLLRGSYLQLGPDHRLAELEKREFQTTITLQSRRGIIYDRHGHELAVSVGSESLFADPTLIGNAPHYAWELSRVLHQPYAHFLKLLTRKKTRFVWIRRHVSVRLVKIVSAWKNRGLGFIQEPKRIYPSGALLANVLGFVGREGQGLGGIEEHEDKSLRDRRVRVTVARDARGRPLLVSGNLFRKRRDGSNVQLTIDEELQYMLERELRKTKREHRADLALGIVEDARTSEILAMAQVPSFDPNQPLASPASHRRNDAVSEVFEPGSTMKPFVMAAALASGKVEPNTKFNCHNGRIEITGHIIREATPAEKFKMLTASEILAYSSNVGISEVAKTIGQKPVYQMYRDFGFGTQTGIGLPGESDGLFRSPPWRPLHFANIAFGQGVGVTALQLVNAYTAIADGGVLKSPIIVKQIQNPQTGKSKTFQARVIRRVLTPVQASQLTLMLSTVTAKGGTGVKARVPGFPVAGKTGTAQVARPDGRGYEPHSYLADFVGFVPANDPRFVILIAVKNPRKGYYAADVAAPVFRKVAAFALRQASVPPVLISKQNLFLIPKNPASTSIISAVQPKTAGTGVAKVPDLVGLSLRDALNDVRSLPIHLRVVGHGHVVRLVPPAHSLLSSRERLTVYLK